MGWIAGRPLTPANWRRALVVGTALASFCVQDFGVRNLRKLTPEMIGGRVAALRSMMSVGSI